MKIIKMFRGIFNLSSNLTDDNLKFANSLLGKYDLKLTDEDSVRIKLYSIIEDSTSSVMAKIRVQKYMDKNFSKKWVPKEDVYLQYEDYENLIYGGNNHINFSLLQVSLAADREDGYIGTSENINYYLS